jgi:drug/metabolite transporter (DMT)-like permease
LVVWSGLDAGPSRITGNLLILASALVWATSTVISRPLSVKAHPLAVLTHSMPGAIPALLLYGASETMRTDYSQIHLISWLMVLYIAVCAGAIGFVLFYAGVRAVGASGAMVHQYFVPMVAALSSWLFLGQGIGWGQVAGFLIILSGVTLASRSVHQPVIEAVPAGTISS